MSESVDGRSDGVSPGTDITASAIPTETRRGPLLERVRALAAARSRMLLGVTGPPGAGKTTLGLEIVEWTGGAACVVGMDGFHLSTAQLGRLGRRDRMGAIDTFDAAGFITLLRRLREGSEATVYAPEFCRMIEEPISGGVAIEADVRLVVVEGNYLLALDEPWNEARELLDEVWYCEPAEDIRLANLIARHRAYGKSEDEARRWALGPDQRNAELIASTRSRADLLVTLDPGHDLVEEQVAPVNGETTVSVGHRERYLVRFGLPGPNGRDPEFERIDSVAAGLHGVDVATYRELQRSFSVSAEDAARALLADPQTGQLVDQLPWEPGSAILTIGDSITADRESWAEILRHALARRRGTDRFELINAAVDGSTSTDVLGRVGAMTGSGARYALILIGTNDAQGHGRDALPLVSDTETLRNVDQILATLSAGGIEGHLIAPPPASLDQLSRHLSTVPIGWEHLDAKREALRAHEACLFDCADAFGAPPDERLLIDGLHPNLDGQIEIVRGVLAALADPRRPKTS